MQRNSTSSPVSIPRIASPASSMLLTTTPLISTIRTPGSTPALSAGPSGTEIFVIVRSAAMFMPKPPDALSPFATMYVSRSLSVRAPYVPAGQSAPPQQAAGAVRRRRWSWRWAQPDTGGQHGRTCPYHRCLGLLPLGLAAVCDGYYRQQQHQRSSQRGGPHRWSDR
jgi:hypothetical protein